MMKMVSFKSSFDRFLFLLERVAIFAIVSSQRYAGMGLLESICITYTVFCLKDYLFFLPITMEASNIPFMLERMGLGLAIRHIVVESDDLAWYLGVGTLVISNLVLLALSMRRRSFRTSQEKFIFWAERLASFVLVCFSDSSTWCRIGALAFMHATTYSFVAGCLYDYASSALVPYDIPFKLERLALSLAIEYSKGEIESVRKEGVNTLLVSNLVLLVVTVLMTRSRVTEVEDKEIGEESEEHFDNDDDKEESKVESEKHFDNELGGIEEDDHKEESKMESEEDSDDATDGEEDDDEEESDSDYESETESEEDSDDASDGEEDDDEEESDSDDESETESEEDYDDESETDSEEDSDDESGGEEVEDNRKETRRENNNPELDEQLYEVNALLKQKVQEISATQALKWAEERNQLEARLNRFAEERRKWDEERKSLSLQLQARLDAAAIEKENRFAEEHQKWNEERKSLSLRLRDAKLKLENYVSMFSEFEESLSKIVKEKNELEETCSKIIEEQSNLRERIEAESSSAEHYNMIANEYKDRCHKLEEQKTRLTASLSASKALNELYRGYLYDLGSEIL